MGSGGATATKNSLGATRGLFSGQLRLSLTTKRFFSFNEILRQGGGKGLFFTVWQRDCKRKGMQRKAFKAKKPRAAFGAIEAVGHYRVPDGRKVHAYLMRAACFRKDLDVGGASAAPDR